MKTLSRVFVVMVMALAMSNVFVSGGCGTSVSTTPQGGTPVEETPTEEYNQAEAASSMSE